MTACSASILQRFLLAVGWPGGEDVLSSLLVPQECVQGSVVSANTLAPPTFIDFFLVRFVREE